MLNLFGLEILQRSKVSVCESQRFREGMGTAKHTIGPNIQHEAARINLNDQLDLKGSLDSIDDHLKSPEELKKSVAAIRGYAFWQFLRYTLHRIRLPIVIDMLYGFCLGTWIFLISTACITSSSIKGRP